ncbi:hypothetical protein [uncultured Sphingobium sp.]|uniref:hypothetical protein n=1 Tax=uncultured Sphingobium sp. TaxID=316087 RepID=UPI00259B0DC9|nr:hypothetical protein [uncultured Sphingobium sp.]
MSERSELRLVHGGRNLVELLEEQLAKVKAGEVEILVVATVDTDKVQRWSWAYVDGIDFAWARMVAAVAGVSHDLMSDGI